MILVCISYGEVNLSDLGFWDGPWSRAESNSAGISF